MTKTANYEGCRSNMEKGKLTDHISPNWQYDNFSIETETK